MSDPIIGNTYSVNYPFKLERVELWDDEDQVPNVFDDLVPGCLLYEDEYDCRAVADAIGAMLLTVISIHKPGKYPERVFYIRQWEKPCGKVFGKKNLRITTTSNFKKMLRGYRHEFQMFSDEDEIHRPNNPIPF